MNEMQLFLKQLETKIGCSLEDFEENLKSVKHICGEDSVTFVITDWTMNHLIILIQELEQKKH